MSDAAVASPPVRRAPARIVLAEQPPGFQTMVLQWQELLTEPYKGVTTDGHPDPRFFRRRKTGLSAAPAKAAVEAVLAALDDAEVQRARFSLDDRAWRSWSNIHRNVARHGVCLDTLSDRQRQLVLDVVRTCTSPDTFREVQSTMRLNEHTSELTGKPDQYGEWFYYFSVFGEPSLDGPWGWQLDGHHVNVNCFLLGGEMVLTPMLLGAEPVKAESGKYAGTSILTREEAAGWRLMQALRPEQRTRATLGLELPFDGLGSGFKDNLQVPYQGVSFLSLDALQQDVFMDLLSLYVGRQPKPHAEIRMAEVKFHLAATHFAWIGPFDETSPFYYRVHSPVIYIEFFHQPGIALPNNGFTRKHAHALVRTPNGNDYGRVLLAEHRREHGKPAVSGEF